MLIIGRKREQKIIIDDDIEITILEIGRNRVRFGIRAPQHVRVQTKAQTSPDEETRDAPKRGRGRQAASFLKVAGMPQI